MKFQYSNKKISGVEDYLFLTNLNSDRITDFLEEYVFELNQTLKPKSINAFLAPVELFFEMNRKIWHRKLVRKLIQKNDAEQFGMTPITNHEIQEILKVCKHPRDTALVFFLASTGIRPSGLLDPILSMKHIHYMPDPQNKSNKKYCYAVRVYNGSNESYWVFLTPEATKALDTYFTWRKQIRHEEFDDDTPVFGSVSKMSSFDHMTMHAMYTLLKKIYGKSGLKREKKGSRYNKAMVYMFRKRFNTILKLNNDVNSNIAEKLMAHKRGLDGTYLQPTQDECYKEFVKAIPDLTISESERQQIMLEQKEKENSELQKKISEIEEMKQQQDADRKQRELERKEDKEQFLALFSDKMAEMRKFGYLPK